MLEEVMEQTWPPGDSEEGLQAMRGSSCSPSRWNASPAHHSLSRGCNHFKDVALTAVCYWDHPERRHHWTKKRVHQIHGIKEILPELISYVELTIKCTAYFITVCVCVCVCVCVRSVVSNSLQPHGLQPARLLIHGILQARTLEWVAISYSMVSY